MRHHADDVLGPLLNFEEQLLYPRHTFKQLLAIRDGEFFWMLEKVATIFDAKRLQICFPLPVAPGNIRCQGLFSKFSIWVIFTDRLCGLLCSENGGIVNNIDLLIAEEFSGLIGMAIPILV